MKANQFYLFTILIVLFVMSCNTVNNRFEIIQSKGLDAENLGLQTMLFCNSDTGFIAGSSDKVTHNPDETSSQFAFVNKTSLLYKTTDGGNTWKVRDFGEGNFQNILHTKGSLYAFKIRENFYTDIYYSDDFGENWKAKTTFPNVATDLFFINGHMILIAKDERRIFQFYVSDDEGQNWVKRISPYLPIYDILKTDDNKFCYLSSRGNSSYQKNLLVSFDVQDSSSKAMDLPKGFDCYFLTNNANQIKLCGKKEDKITVYSFRNNKLQYEYSTSDKDSMNFPFAFYNTKNEDYIVVGHRRSNDVEHKILKTADNGKTWRTIKFERDNLIEPFCFFNNNGKVKAWFFAGAGKFQVLQ